MASTTTQPAIAALSAGALAVITGAATGIGRATALRCASRGMNLALIDIDESGLAATASHIAAAAHPSVRVLTRSIDVSDADAFAGLKSAMATTFGVDVVPSLLMNNAGVGTGAGALVDPKAWDRTMGINFWGVVNGCRAFVDDMIKAGGRRVVANVGSKQGITCPPGNLAYNVSKAAVKTYTEGLQHELRNAKSPDGSTLGEVSAHLLIPGWTNTSIFVKAKVAMGQDPTGIFFEENPAKGGWMPDQVVDFLFTALETDRFYILCPDNEVDVATDHSRILWAAGDIVHDRSPLSRWDPKYAEEFKAFLASRAK